MAAVGTPLSAATVELRCATQDTSTTTNAQGAWRVEIAAGSTPCLVKASGGTPPVTLYSYATEPGTVNITPLTTLAVASAAATGNLDAWFDTFDTAAVAPLAVAVADAGDELVQALAAAGHSVPAGFNPFTSAFSAQPGDAHDDLLEAFAATLEDADQSFEDFVGDYIDGGSLPSIPEPNPTVYYTVGGSVSGLSGTLVLQNNGGGNLSITDSGSFAFESPLAAGSSYAVSVLTQPANQTCSVGNGSGTADANVTTVSIVCQNNPPQTYTVGGSVSGLSGTLVLQNNGGGNLSIIDNGNFTFAEPVTAGGSYKVTVFTQPAAQTCIVANGSGTISAKVTNVTVTCHSGPLPTYTISVNASGIPSTAVLQNNGGDNLSVHGNGLVKFATPVTAGGAYDVTVLSPPQGFTCTIENGKGIANGNVNNIYLSCKVVVAPLDLSAIPQCVNADGGHPTLLDGRNGAAAMINGTACVNTNVQELSGWPLWTGQSVFGVGDTGIIGTSDPLKISLRQVTATQGYTASCQKNGVPSISIKIGDRNYSGSPVDGRPAISCQLTVTEVGPTHYAGTFSGTFYDAVNDSTLNVTKGEFRYNIDLFPAGEGKPQVSASFEGLPAGKLNNAPNAVDDFGWQGQAWSANSPDLADTSASPLSVTVGGQTITGGGRAMQISGQSGGWGLEDWRRFTHGFNGDLYVSVLLRIDAASITANSSRTMVVFGNRAWGFGVDNSNGTDQFVARLPGDGNIARFGGVVEGRRSYLLVVKLGKADGSDSYNRLDAWLDPTVDELASPHATVTVSSGGTGSRRIIDRMGLSADSQTPPLQLDRFRFSDNWQGLFAQDDTSN